MARHIAAGIDIGTYQVKAVIAEELVLESGRVMPKIIGTGTSESKGLHQGYITNQSEVTRSVRAAVAAAEKAAGVEVKRAFVSVGGIGLSGVATTGSTAISRADLEITPLDIEKASESAEAAIPHALSLNRKIINTIPLEWKLDGKTALGRIEGSRASKIEVKTLFITCLEHHLEDLIGSVEEAGIEVVDVVAAPIAASFVTLSKKQKKAGCVLANIGAETLSIVVFENSNPISLEVFEIGSMDITNDIALGLKIPLEEAESIKLGSVTRTTYPKKKYEDIVAARLSDMFELVEGHLKKIGRNALLPAGIIITGGGAGIMGVRDAAETALKLPSKIAEIHFGDVEKHGSKDSIWSIAFGLAIVGFNSENEQGSVGLKPVAKLAASGKRGMRTLSEWFSKFLP
ncbi:pilus assembly protein PilM [Candidatus Parcubacteria bacterium]|nr:pilus assembly protein PilM [Candidatus Parcubacteria bacterium]